MNYECGGAPVGEKVTAEERRERLPGDNARIIKTAERASNSIPESAWSTVLQKYLNFYSFTLDKSLHL